MKNEEDNGTTVILIMVAALMVSVIVSGAIGVNVMGFLWGLVTIILISYILYRQDERNNSDKF